MMRRLLAIALLAALAACSSSNPMAVEDGDIRSGTMVTAGG
jgi:hypothetical protein